MDRAFLRAPGVLIEALDDTWVVFSALSGETHLLNDSSVALLDLLSPEMPRTHDSICAALAEDTGLPHIEVESLIQGAWEMLITGGLVRECPPAHSRVP